MDRIFDIAIIGGGINGCGIAADASLRGLSVLLLEQSDLGSGTSSASTKLIHGGLRYLEHYEFKLVRKALNERQILLNVAKHLVHPLELILPIHQLTKPAWLIRSGLFIYDHLSFKNELPAAKQLSRQNNPDIFLPLKDNINKAFRYFDALTDDNRLTIANARQAHIHGATILTHHPLKEATFKNNLWLLKAHHKNNEYTFNARTLINATGPWLNQVNDALYIKNPKKLTLVQGSHIVLPKFYEGDHAFFIQNHDKRILFVIPWHQGVMVGTTERLFEGSLSNALINDEECRYMLDAVHSVFKVKFNQNDIIYQWSGVRPLASDNHNDLTKITRDYQLLMSDNPGPVLHIIGGKITTYRQLATEAVSKLSPILGTLPESNTDKTYLPGSDYSDEDKERLLKKWSFLPSELLNRYWSQYGICCDILLNDIQTIEDLGECISGNLYEREVQYLCEYEWVEDADDILWRRTKVGLCFDFDKKPLLQSYIDRFKLK